MSQRKSRFGEQGINRFIEMVLARLVNADSVQARIQAPLKQLTRGEIDGLSIQMMGFLLRQHLRVTELHFEIGAAAVNLQKVMRRKIELLHPTTGALRLVITPTQLSRFLQAELLNPVSPTVDTHELKLHCTFHPEQQLALHWQGPQAEATGTTFIQPRLAPDRSGMLLEPQGVTGEQPSAASLSTAIALLTSVLSLQDLANQGTHFQIQTLVIEPDRLTVQAAATIEQFPSG